MYFQKGLLSICMLCDGMLLEAIQREGLSQSRVTAYSWVLVSSWRSWWCSWVHMLIALSGKTKLSNKQGRSPAGKVLLPNRMVSIHSLPFQMLLPIEQRLLLFSYHAVSMS